MTEKLSGKSTRIIIRVPIEWDQRLKDLAEEWTKRDLGVFHWDKGAVVRVALKEFFERLDAENNKQTD